MNKDLFEDSPIYKWANERFDRAEEDLRKTKEILDATSAKIFGVSQNDLADFLLGKCENKAGDCYCPKCKKVVEPFRSFLDVATENEEGQIHFREVCIICGFEFDRD